MNKYIWVLRTQITDQEKAKAKNKGQRKAKNEQKVQISECVRYKYGKQESRVHWSSAAAAKSLHSCLTLCDPIDGSPPGSPIPGILQARTLEWDAISFSNAWKWIVKVKSLSRIRLLVTPWTAAYQAPLSMGFSRQEYWSGLPLPSPFGHLRTGKMPLSIIASTTANSRDKQWFLQCPWFRWRVPLSQAAPWVLKRHKNKGENIATGSQWWVSPVHKFILSNTYSKFMMTCRIL